MVYQNREKAAKRIAKIFKQMGWEWWDHIKPNEQQILKSLADKYETLTSKPEVASSRSGRLFAERLRDTDLIIYGLEEGSVDEWREWCEHNEPLIEEE